MSLSTTTSTTAYTLIKYSRAYPSSSRTQEADVEWQHFTNPTIRLVLDMRKSSSGELESYRCRVLWSLSLGNDAMDVDQNEVTFEDLELLSFSSPAMLQSQRQIFAIHGLPLKAVYRDAIVGIRYQYPRIVPPGATPTYRRFQMNFRNVSDASSFVDAIRPVCPCKANPPAAPATLPNRSVTMVPAASSSGYATGASVSAELSKKQALRPSMTMQPPHLPDVLRQQQSMTVDQTLQSNQKMARPSSSARTVSADPIEPSGGAPQATIDSASQQLAAQPAQRLEAAPMLSTVACSAPIVINMGNPEQGSGPSTRATDGATAGPAPLSLLQEPAVQLPSLISDRNSVSLPQTPQAPQINAVQQPGLHDALLTSLREVPPLYDLPRAELELLVTQVIREDGFIKLLQSLDLMWKLKILLGPESTLNQNSV